MTAVRLALLLAACLATLVDAAQQPTFSARREIVRVDVLVSDRGKPVRDLKASDFDVLDSGVPQTIESVSFETLPVNVALVLDNSKSISPERLRDLREGGAAVLASMAQGDQAALLTFTDAITLRERLSTRFSAVGTALERMQASQQTFGGTALIDASYAAMTILEADAGRGLAIVFTDGVDTSSWLTAARVLQGARRANVVVYAVSTAPLPKGSFLRELADLTGGGAIEISSSTALRSTFVGILNEFRQRYLIGFSPAGVAASGWHPLTVRVKSRRLDVRSRPGYIR